MEERLGIAGSGAIARGLAAVAAEHGPVVLWARSEESAQRTRDKLAEVSALTVTTELEALSEASYVVESIVEEHEPKADLLGRLDAVLAGDAVLATTTSSLSLGELAAASGRAERFAALHVFNPVGRMKLVEVAFPEQSSPETRARTLALCEALDKEAVEVPADLPGFVVNRLLFPFLFDAVRLLERTGMEPEQVDTCMKLGAGHPMGPLALLDFVGLDVSVAIGEAIGAEVPDRVRELVDRGKLGRKVKAGFYTYD